MRIDRRGLLIGGGVGAGLLVGWALWPDGPPDLPVEEGSAEIAGLLSIEPSGVIRLHVPQVEYGQGIWTGLAQAAADAMGASLDQLSVQPLAAGSGFANPLVERTFGAAIRLTGAASSTRAFVEPMRAAGAAARAMLMAEAADRSGSDIAALSTRNSYVVGGERPLAFAELAEGAAARPVPDAAVGDWAAGGVLGTDAPRVDVAPKIRGDWRFAGDVRLPDMVFAAARMAPEGKTIRRHDAAAASVVPGLIELVAEDGFVAAVADNSWSAAQAIRLADVRVAADTLDDDRMVTRMLTALDGEGEQVVAIGEARERVTGNYDPIAAIFSAAPLVHHGLDAQSAAAQPRSDGGIDLWAGTLVPDATRRAAARATGLSEGAIRLIPMGVGEDTGRSLAADAAPIAATLALRLSRPVSVTLGPRHSAAAGPLRPPMLARVAATVAGGRIDAMDARIVTMPQLGASVARAAGDDPQGARFKLASPVLPYAIPHLGIEMIDPRLPLRTGYHRGGEQRLALFAFESMIDEVARRVGGEPLSFRIGMLQGEVRMAQLLTIAAQSADWDGGGAGSKMGLACGRFDDSRIALVVEARREGAAIAVDRMTAAVDCGRAINPALVKAQVAGGLLSALEDALSPPPRIVDGLVVPTPRRSGRGALTALPEIEVVLLPSDEAPGGVSTLGASVLAPALANALAATTSPRLRHLPLTAMSPFDAQP